MMFMDSPFMKIYIQVVYTINAHLFNEYKKNVFTMSLVFILNIKDRYTSVNNTENSIVSGSWELLS